MAHSTQVPDSTPAPDIVLSVQDLSIAIGTARAVEHISFDIRQGEIAALVGESGCGKSLTALSLLRLLPGNISTSGRIVLGDQEMIGASDEAVRLVRGNSAAMIFQEPVASLNPVKKIGEQVMEPLLVHTRTTRAAAREEAIRTLRAVGIPDPELRFEQFPFELSGGMCQRIVIAMALICRPRLLIADEPTTALDVTIQAQIMELLKQLQVERNTAILMITHDMGIVAEMADRVYVMYAGSLVERGTVDDVFANPLHPYTRLLLSTIPQLDGKRKTQLPTIEGTVPQMKDWPDGCRFRTRCPHAWARCAEPPPSYAVGDSGHRAACWLLAGEDA